VTLLAPERSPCLRWRVRPGIEARSLGVLAVRQASQRSDVVHAHDAHSHTLAALMAVNRRRRRP